MNDNSKTLKLQGHTALYWYDKSLRLWSVYLIDDEQNQISEVQYCDEREMIGVTAAYLISLKEDSAAEKANSFKLALQNIDDILRGGESDPEAMARMLTKAANIAAAALREHG